MSKTCLSCTIRAKKPREQNLWLLSGLTFDDTDSVSSNEFIDMNTMIDKEGSYSWYTGRGLYINGIVITSTHIVSGSSNIIGNLADSTIELDIYKKVIGYDITIMKLKDQYITDADVYKALSMIKFLNFSKVNKGTNIETLDTLLKLTIDSVLFAKLTSEMCPKIPLFQCDVKDIETSSLEGYSGSFVHVDDKMVGMIISMMNGHIEIMSFEIIKLLIANCMNSPPKVLPMNVSLCEIDINDSICDITCLYVKEQTINFNTNKKKNVGFKQGCVISGINGLNFNKFGEIYYATLDCYIPYDTYLLLWGKDIMISYYKPDDDKIKNIIIKQKNVTDDVFGVRIFDSGVYYNHNGMIFAELSEQIIAYCKTNNITLPYEIVKSYGKMITSDKIIVMVNIRNLHIETKKQFVDHGVLISNVLNKYPILLKIGNKRIKSLKDIYSAHSSVFTFINDDMTEFKVTDC
jgi:hypothetical protein